MWSNGVAKAVAILCSATLWLYVMWIYTNVEMNGWQSGWVFTIAVVGTIGIATMVAMNLEGDSDKTKKGEPGKGEKQ